MQLAVSIYLISLFSRRLRNTYSLLKASLAYKNYSVSGDSAFFTTIAEKSILDTTSGTSSFSCFEICDEMIDTIL